MIHAWYIQKTMSDVEPAYKHPKGVKAVNYITHHLNYEIKKTKWTQFHFVFKEFVTISLSFGYHYIYRSKYVKYVKRKWFVWFVVCLIYGTACIIFHVTFEIDFFIIQRL